MNRISRQKATAATVFAIAIAMSGFAGKASAATARQDAAATAQTITVSIPAEAPQRIAIADKAVEISKTANVALEAPVSEAAQPTGEELALLALLNEDRATQGLSPLTLDPRLCRIAREHSKDMCDRGYFGHFAPTPGASSPTERYIAAIGYRPSYAMIGENVYFRSMTDKPAETADQAEWAFMHSEGHRANIVQPKFNKVGIGFFRSEGRFWVTQMFLGDAE